MPPLRFLIAGINSKVCRDCYKEMNTHNSRDYKQLRFVSYYLLYPNYGQLKTHPAPEAKLPDYSDAEFGRQGAWMQ